MKFSICVVTFCVSASTAPASAEMPLWSYFDKYWGVLEDTCGFAIVDPQSFVDGSPTHAVSGMPLWMRTTDNSNFTVLQAIDGVQFFVSIATVPNVRQVTCETGEPDDQVLSLMSDTEPSEVGRQLTAWMDTKPDFKYAGGQLLLQNEADTDPITDREFDYVINSTLGGQDVFYTIGIYGAGLDLYLTHQIRQ